VNKVDQLIYSFKHSYLFYLFTYRTVCATLIKQRIKYFWG